MKLPTLFNLAIPIGIALLAQIVLVPKASASDDYKADKISNLFAFALTGSGTTCAPRLSLEKTATWNDTSGDGFAQVGETITYTFNICNLGDAPITGVYITDPIVNVVGGPLPIIEAALTGSGTPSGEIYCYPNSFSAVYTIQAVDIANGEVVNTATAFGYDMSGALHYDYSDDPTNFDNVDLDNDGYPDDPTVTTLPISNVNPNSAAIGNSVWRDLDGDGVMDSNESGIQGVRVELYSGAGVLLQYIYTNAQGSYLFDELPSGDYFLKFYTPTGMSFTGANIGSNNNADSDVDGSNGPGTTQTTNLSVGEIDNSWDVGMYTCIPVGQYTWYDTNKNNVWDLTENGINGIKVEIYKAQGTQYTLYDYQYTGHEPGSASNDGYWKMCVPPGQYYVKFLIPPYGLVAAQPNIGGNEAKDSDITSSFGSGTTAAFTVLSGQEKCDIGAGYYPQATIGNRVWYDDNRNGIQDVTESGAAGVTVNVVNSQGGIVSQLTTDASGNYLADYLQASQYYIQITPPVGYAVTTPNVGTEDTDSDIDHTNGLNTTPYYITNSGENIEYVDAGLVSSSILASQTLLANANRSNGVNIVNWTVNYDTEIEEYAIERMLENDSHFSNIGMQMPIHSDAATTYSFADTDSNMEGQYFYRVKMTTTTGESKYSSIVMLDVKADQVSPTSFSKIYPNPAINNITLEVNVIDNNADIVINILNDKGQKVLANSVLEVGADAGKHNYKIEMSQYTKGVYLIEVMVGTQVEIQKLVLID